MARSQPHTAVRSLLALALGLGAPLFGAGAPAFAASRTYNYQGTVYFVSDGLAGSLDLRSQFSVGQQFGLSVTVDPNTAPFSSDPTTAQYLNLVTSASASIGSYTIVSTGGTTSLAQVDDNITGNGATCGLSDPSPIDEFIVQVHGIDGAAVNGGTPLAVNFLVLDCESDGWTGTALPLTPPAIPDVANSSLSAFFSDGTNTGFVLATIEAYTLPTRSRTWGSLKVAYR